ncbi:MAG: hypothetical protein QOE76_3998, partial [Frankiales bacterium]|nr:hypothetical protein [Frankiales bacterium]
MWAVCALVMAVVAWWAVGLVGDQVADVGLQQSPGPTSSTPAAAPLAAATSAAG